MLACLLIGDSGGEGDKSSVVVSMEVNGVLYQGVLFAKKWNSEVFDWLLIAMTLPT